MKKMIMRLLSPMIPVIVDELLNVLTDLARRTDTSIDDDLVENIRVNREEIISGLKGML